MKFPAFISAPHFEGIDLNGKPYKIWLKQGNTIFPKIFIQWGRQKFPDLMTQNVAFEAPKTYLSGLYKGSYSDVVITFEILRNIFTTLLEKARHPELIRELEYELKRIDFREGKVSEEEWKEYFEKHLEEIKGYGTTRKYVRLVPASK